MSHQPHEKVIYVISKQIQYIVIEPQVNCWAISCDIWQSTESLSPVPSLINADVTVSPRPFDYGGQQGSESLDERPIINVGVEVTNCLNSSSRTHAPENQKLETGNKENLTGKLSEIPTSYTSLILREHGI